MKTHSCKITFVFGALRACLTLALLFGITATVRAQSALDGFAPNANGLVRAVVVQPDGKILIGGEFTSVEPNGGAAIVRNRIARFNPDGTLDTVFNPGANNVVYTIAVQPDGRVLAGGVFDSIGGQSRNRIARLDPVTGAADAFNPNASATVGTGIVRSIVVQADGKILAGGGFTTIGGQLRNYIARLDPATGAADAFNPNPNGIINIITVQPDGKILVGGVFESIGGQARNNIARLDAASGLADSFNPNANNNVDAIAVQADGKVVVVGGFNTVGGQTRISLARLDAASGLADSFTSGTTNGFVYAIAIQTDGKILVGGNYTVIGGQPRRSVARFDAFSGQLDAFSPNANGGVVAIAVQQDGKVIIGGNFSAVNPNNAGITTRSNIARFERDGRLDVSNGIIVSGIYVLATAVQPDGKILIGGLFTTVSGETRRNIARFNTDGTLDTAFNPNIDNQVNAIVVQPDGKILVGGSFVTVGGQPRNHIARLDAATGAPDSFNPNANNTVWTIALQGDGAILVGGSFFGANSIGGATRAYLARLDPSTGAADGFNPSPNSDVSTIVVQADGKILVAGYFRGANSIGGQARTGIARLDAATGLADSFDPMLTIFGVPYSLALQSDGKVLVGGSFTTIGGQTRNNIARLDAISGAADSFNPDVNRTVNAIAVLQDGKVLAGGDFTTVGGRSQFRFARLTNDTAALSTLTATNSTVTLTRGGSAVQFVRVVFEQSTDGGATFTTLGNATPSFNTPQRQSETVKHNAAEKSLFGERPANDDAAALTVRQNDSINGGVSQIAPSVPQAATYTLSGLSLPLSQNILIRARGFFRSGVNTGGESIEEKTQNIFLMPTTAAEVTIGGRVTIGAKGLRRTRVYLTDMRGATRHTTTDENGYYRFTEVATGETYIVGVHSKRFTFTPQVVTVTEDLNELNFSALR